MDEKSKQNYTELFLEKWKLMARLAEEYTKLVGLTPMSLNVLSIIYENPQNCTQKLICKFSQYNKQSVNMIIKSFLQQGYVELVEMKEDRRNKYVILSEIGKAYADKVIALFLKIENSAIEKMTSQQRDALLVFFDEYEHSLRCGLDEVADALNMKD